VVECVVIVVFCVVFFGPLNSANFFEIYFCAFPFWESAAEKKASPGLKPLKGSSQDKDKDNDRSRSSACGEG
jgi:hypothetical protein